MTASSSIRIARETDPVIKTRVSIRWMLVRDIETAVEIESRSFPDSEWGAETFRHALSSRDHIAYVAEVCDQFEPSGYRVVGYIICELIRDQYSIINIAVAPGFRREGIGRQLMDKFKQNLDRGIRKSILVIVRERNLYAQLFLKRLGFLCETTVRGHWPGTDEDGYAFRFVEGMGDCEHR